jgi:ubiquinone/menaquinone biosynthesis C-methylase UbiE
VEVVRRAYVVQAQRYIELFGTTAQVHADDLALVARHLSIRPGTVLDVGCGPGHMTEHLRSLGVDAIGIDLVPEFIEHARTAYPHGRYELGSIDRLPVPDHSVSGMLAWYSLIHLPPEDLDGVLAEFRRAMAPTATLVAGFFDGDKVTAFEHKVVTAWFWPVDEFSARLRRAGFTEVERTRRPAQDGHRPHAAIAAVAS